MASVQYPPSQLPIAEYHVEECDSDTECDEFDADADCDAENIPYHARQNARPFTYGNLPEGFTVKELNHVETKELQNETNNNQQQYEQETTQKAVPLQQSMEFKNSRMNYQLPPSPGVQRKSNRPAIAPSRPVLHKTPSREEFEEMLRERKEQCLRDQNHNATKAAQNAAIQKDLDELQEILSKKVQQEQENLEQTKRGMEIVRHVESIDLPDFLDNANRGLKAIEDVKQSNNLKENEENRPETPSFPALPSPPQDGRCISPYPHVAPSTPKTPKSFSLKQKFSFKKEKSETPQEQHEVEPHLVKFAKDSSEFWYKPHMTREEAVALLRHSSPGSFIIRSSTTYKNAYGLVLRVEKPPPGVIISENSAGDELVRHYLLEPTQRGVRLKGCSNEPVFTSLSAFVYQHSINQLALPCKLIIPESDLIKASGDASLMAAQKQLLEQGAACNVLYLFSCNMESLTGDEALRRAVHEMLAQKPLPKPVEVHLKVSAQGITLTDNTRTLFFRRHYVPQNISHFALDPDNHSWQVAANDEGYERIVNKSIFGFVARPLTGLMRDNQCHLFCDLAVKQPATAIVSFANKVLPMMDKQRHKML